MHLTNFYLKDFEYSKEVIRIRESKKDIQQNGQRANNDLQNINI